MDKGKRLRPKKKAKKEPSESEESKGSDSKKIFTCPYKDCGKQFSESGNLKTHIRIHTGERPFVCTYEGCGKSFITKGHLKSHILTHTGEKPHVCAYCGKKYSRIGRLTIHTRTHTGEKPFKCHYHGCSKSFTEKGNLKTHLRIHTGEKPYKCDFPGCEKRFTTQGHLKDHIRRHNNERPFTCSVCNASFLRASTLKIHNRRHTGERPYKCPYEGCGKGFSESGNLKTHMKIHERNKKKKTKGRKIGKAAERVAKAGKVVKQGSSANNNIALKNTTESQDEIEEPEPIAKVQPASEQNNTTPAQPPADSSSVSAKPLDELEEKKENLAAGAAINQTHPPIPVPDCFERLPLNDASPIVSSFYPGQGMSPLSVGGSKFNCGSPQIPGLTTKYTFPYGASSTPGASANLLASKMLGSPMNGAPNFAEYANFTSFANATPLNTLQNGGGFGSYNPLFGSGNTSPCFAAAQLQGLSSDNLMYKPPESKDN